MSFFSPWYLSAHPHSRKDDRLLHLISPLLLLRLSFLLDRSCRFNAPRRRNLELQFPQLLRIDSRGRVAHQVGSAGSLRERDHLANIRLTAHQRNCTVPAERDPAVRWSTAFESVEQKSEAGPRLLFGDAERAEHPPLNVGPVNTNRAAAQLRAVQHHVISAGLAGRRIG